MSQAAPRKRLESTDLIAGRRIIACVADDLRAKAIFKYLNGQEGHSSRHSVTMRELLFDCLNLPSAHVQGGEAHYVGHVLRSMGWGKSQDRESHRIWKRSIAKRGGSVRRCKRSPLIFLEMIRPHLVHCRETTVPELCSAIGACSSTGTQGRIAQGLGKALRELGWTKVRAGLKTSRTWKWLAPTKTPSLEKWPSIIEAYLLQSPIRKTVSVRELLRDCLHLPDSTNPQGREAARVGQILHESGWVKKRMGTAKRIWVWVSPLVTLDASNDCNAQGSASKSRKSATASNRRPSFSPSSS